jgi:acyl-coenzyme A synthetase/AMP-(fatty) acid ligase
VVPVQPADPPSLDQLRGFVRQRLAAANAPRDLVLVAELPRSPSGKLLRRRLDAAPSALRHQDSGGR